MRDSTGWQVVARGQGTHQPGPRIARLDLGATRPEVPAGNSIAMPVFTSTRVARGALEEGNFILMQLLCRSQPSVDSSCGAHSDDEIPIMMATATVIR